MRRLLAIIFILSAAVFADATQPNAAPTSQLQQDIFYLASPELQGRGVGTHGLDLAANYIATRFASLHLQPLKDCPDDFQTFTMTAPASVGEQTFLQVDQSRLEIDRDFQPMGFSHNAAFSGSLVFAGYGISDTARKYDDYADQDVRGKIVLIFRFEPRDSNGKSKFTGGDFTNDSQLTSKAAAAFTHGATAVLMVNPKNEVAGDSLMSVNAASARCDLPFIQITRTAAEKILNDSSAPHLDSLEGSIDENLTPHTMEIKSDVRGNVEIERRNVPVKNALAFFPGNKHPDEFVVVGAHYDHLGNGSIGSLDQNSAVHPGADDNASGTATLMELAARLSHGPPLDRSVLFVGFTGEESGLIGSEYFVSHPPIPLTKIVAMLNMDMVGRLRNETLYIGGDGTAADFEKLTRDADANLPLKIKSIGKGGFGPTDHQSFAEQKIPVMFLFTGMHADYHRATDTADKINVASLDEIATFAQRLIVSLASEPRENYVDQFDAQGLAIGGTNPAGNTQVMLGVVPDYGSDVSSAGVKITGTSPDSPAEKAGLCDGDVITKIDAKQIDNLYDLTEFLSQATADQTIMVTVRRADQIVQLRVTLEQRKG